MTNHKIGFLVPASMQEHLKREIFEQWQTVQTIFDSPNSEAKKLFLALHKLKGLCLYLEYKALNQQVEALTESCRADQMPLKEDIQHCTQLVDQLNK